MSPIEAALLVAALALPFHFVVRWQLGLLSSPRYLRKHGYRFGRVATPPYQVKPRELLLAPGLVYVTD